MTAIKVFIDMWMLLKSLVFAVLVATFVSCTVPKKYTRMEYNDASGGYLVAAEGPKGIALETYTVGYYFMPHSHLAAEKGRRHFLKCAQNVAAKNSKAVEVAVIDEAKFSRNILTGTYKTTLTGVAVIGNGPQAQKVQDNSMLEQLAEASLDNSKAIMAMGAAAAAANRTIAVNNLSHSIQDNTRAIESLRSDLRMSMYR